MMHRHAPSGLALGAFGIRRVEGARVSGLKLQLGDVAVEQDETLLAQQDPIREAQPIDHSLWPAGPRA
jgi:hypothetical protein